jgi:hypothetical protein
MPGRLHGRGVVLINRLRLSRDAVAGASVTLDSILDGAGGARQTPEEARPLGGLAKLRVPDSSSLIIKHNLDRTQLTDAGVE